ncbi:unnamed protein product [Amoebophrya sp. A120]|nr:unnamed protein product [Amoebophrya sp. A120]|eukprot:GSA120T00024068001.1
MLALLTNLTQYVYNPKDRTAAVLMALATVCLVIGPMRNMCFAVSFHGVCPTLQICMQSYKMAGQVDQTIEMVLDISFNPLLTSKLIQYYTTLGTVLLAVSTAIHMDIVGKFSSLYQEAKRNVAGEDAQKNSTGEEQEQGMPLVKDCAT